MFFATEVEYTALRSLPGFENERASIKLSCENGTDPLEALKEAKRLVNLFLGESKVSSSSSDIPEGDGPIKPDEPVNLAIENK